MKERIFKQSQDDQSGGAPCPLAVQVRSLGGGHAEEDGHACIGGDCAGEEIHQIVVSLGAMIAVDERVLAIDDINESTLHGLELLPHRVWESCQKSRIGS